MAAQYKLEQSRKSLNPTVYCALFSLNETFVFAKCDIVWSFFDYYNDGRFEIIAWIVWDKQGIEVSFGIIW